jgi:DNA modification methylase
MDLELIKKCPVTRLTEYEENPRENDGAVAAVVKSIEAFGFLNPIITDEEFRVCAGHTRLKAARAMNLKSVPVIVAPNLKGNDFRGFNITDNKTAEIADWQDPELAAIIAELEAEDFDIDALGFSAAELDRLATLTGTDEQQQAREDIPEPPADPITQTGDIWVLGDHRLLCGDATDPESVCLLLDGVTPTLCVTDPPYGVTYDPGWRDDLAAKGLIQHGAGRRGKVRHDDVVDWSPAFGLMPCDVIYCWHASLFTHVVVASLERLSFNPRALLIWTKGRPAISRGHYHWQHEPCWYAVQQGKSAGWRGDRKQSTVWEISNVITEAEGKSNHGTQKPFECMARPIRNHTGDVYDPFVGSGTTIIAAEELGRRCFAMDIDPVYCDVAMLRWEKFSGKRAELIR